MPMAVLYHSAPARSRHKSASRWCKVARVLHSAVLGHMAVDRGDVTDWVVQDEYQRRYRSSS